MRGFVCFLLEGVRQVIEQEKLFLLTFSLDRNPLTYTKLSKKHCDYQSEQWFLQIRGLMLNQRCLISLFPNWNITPTKHITDNFILIQKNNKNVIFHYFL